MREIHDFYFKKAKAEGYFSRAAYKLVEIDDRKKIMRPGDRVLDCGCAPGSWLQVASKRVGAKGFVVGIDLQPLSHGFPSNVRVIAGDLTETPPEALLEPGNPAAPPVRTPSPRLFDVILSDMAPNTSGDPSSDHHRSVRLCEAVLDRAAALLKPGGNLVMKVLEGGAYPDLLKRVQVMFSQCKGFKPKASRSESTEIYLVAHDFEGVAADAKTLANEPDVQLPKRGPSKGWAKS
jgi:23S rRNA (uridine2552-2'-O)-methyltransferase